MQGDTVASYLPFKGRSINLSKPVRIYRNLNNGKISIKQGAHVVGHTDQAFLTNARFLVYEQMRQTVLEKEVKSVHAYIQGMWEESYQIPKEGAGIWYNPYLTDSFRTAGDNEICLTAAKVMVTSDGKMVKWN